MTSFFELEEGLNEHRVNLDNVTRMYIEHVFDGKSRLEIHFFGS